jgi:hypothetical protein
MDLQDIEAPVPDFRQLLRVSPALLDEVWTAAVPLLMEGKKYWEDWATLESIYAGVKRDTMQLWLMNDSEEFILCMLTTITENPIRKVLWILWIGGKDLDTAIKRFFDYIELWAFRLGISRVRLSGRMAWMRKLLPQGYKLVEYVVEKDISGIREH